MSNRKRSSRLIFAGITLILVSAFTFATTWSGGAEWLGFAKVSAKSTHTPEAPAAPLTVGTCDGGGNIDVESSGGTPLAGYASLTAAFAAINAGTHTGTIIVEICTSETEPAGSAVLNSSDAAPASYTSINIYPIADGLTVTGTTVVGKGVIELKGSDNVTINGDNPNTGGTNRNLTILNNGTSTNGLASVIRVATAAAVVSADNITVKNLILTGSASGRNIAAATSTTGSENTSFGIYVGGNGGTTATDAPTVLSSVTTNVAPTGTTVNSFVVDNNAINACGRGVVFNGNVAAVSTGITISNNTIGGTGANSGAPPYAAPATTVYTKGIWINGTTALTVTGNTVQNILSYVGTLMDGIELAGAIGAGTINIANNNIQTVAQQNTANTNQVAGVVVTNAGGPYTIGGNTINNIQGRSGSTTAHIAGVFIGTATPASATIEKNKISTIYNRNTGTFGSVGININAGSNITMRNNFIWDVNQDMTGGTSFGNCCGVYGISVVSGTGHKVYHNTVNLTGALIGTATASNMSAAMFIGTTGQTGMDVRNNIFANTMTGGTTSIAHVSIFLPTNAATAMSLTLNNNDYFSGPSATTQGIAQAGATAGVGFYLASNFNAGSTSPATNLRALTTTLGTATNDDSSKVLDPVLVSATDLHIQSTSPAESAGANVGVTTDIDNEARGAVPDMGADEITIIAPGALQWGSPTYGGLEGGTVNAAVNRVGGVTGIVGVTYTIADGTAVGGAACTAGVDYINPGPTVLSFGDGVSSQPVVITLCADAVLDGGETFTMTLSAPTGGATLGSPTVSTVTITDVAPPFTGSVNVGTAQTYTSLTNPGGLFEAINNSSVAGNLTINITSDLTGETGSIPLNQFASPFTVVIKPSGAARNITSTATAISVIKLNDADRVTIDGSLSGGTDRSLSITNINPAGSTAGIWLGSATNGAQNNTVKNTILAGGFDHSTGTPVFNFAIISSTSAAITTGGTDNDNNTFTNNFIKKVSVGIISIGGLASNMNQNTVISNNTIGPAAFGSDQIATLGILAFNENAASITGNEIRFIGDAATTGGSAGRDHVGISLCTGSAAWPSPTIVGSMTNALVSRNSIHDIVDRGTFSVAGIVENCTNAGNPTTNTISNNMLYNILANGTSGDQGVGIGLSQGNGDIIAHNTVYETGDVDPGAASSASTSSFGIRIQTTAVLNPTVRDNIFFMDLSSNTVTLFHSAFDIPTAYSFGTGSSNNNDLYAPAVNTQARVGSVNNGGTFFATLAAWQTATTQDAASISVDPLLVSTTDLHLQPASPAIGAGVLLPGIDNDYDTDLRDNTPDIGADEIPGGGRSGSIPAGTYRDGKLLTSTLAGNVDFTGVLTLGGNQVNAGAFTLGLTCTASVTGAGASTYIIGNTRRDFCTNGAYLFPVGTVANGSALTGEDEASPEGVTGEYSPMTATINAGTTFPSSLTVNVVDTWLPNLGQTSSISRFWNVTETGTVNADMQFQYLPEDVYGDEPNYKPFKYDGVNTTQQPGSINAALNQFTATGVTTFSGWAAGVRVINASEASISGRVTTAGGAGIRNATVRLTGGDLTEPRIVQTGQFGSYSFSGLHVGQTYVLEVGAKRFRFADSTRIFTLQDDLIDVDFTANPNEF